MTPASQDDTAPAPKAKRSRVRTWLALILGVFFLIKGGSRLYDAFFGHSGTPTLAQCDDAGVKGTLQKMARSRKVDLVSITDVKQISRTDAVAQCSAVVTDPQKNKGRLFYHVDFKNGGNTVYITDEKPL